MATFVNTTLTKRTGATTTVFTPRSLDGGVGYFRDSSALTGFGRWLSVSQKYSVGARRTQVRVGIPQLSTDGLVQLAKPVGMIELYIPDGTAQDAVNDIVGYLNALTATGITNLDDILVDGVAVF